jgi:hypothetical protein
MPQETGRTTKNKKIKLPGGSTVLVPVITEISFIDPVARYQETIYTIDNSGNADRDIHVASVKGDGTTDETGQDTSGLQVERLDLWRVLDIVEGAQETFIGFDSKTVRQPPDAPPYFVTHLKTHVVRYQNDPDDGNFIDSELIDGFSVVDPVQQSQETQYSLPGNPVGTDDGNGHMVVTANSDDPDITDSDNGVDPPWRLDPFQNIVNFSGGYLLDIRFDWAGGDVAITCDADPGIILLDNDNSTASSHEFVFNVGLASAAPSTITFSITGQDDYTGFTVFTFGVGSSLQGVTEISGGLPTERPWPRVGIDLYSKSSYHLDVHANPVIQPNNPTAAPGPLAFASFVPIGSMPAVQTRPSTDHFYYFSPPASGSGTGTIEGNGDLILGGSYSQTGLFKDGTLGVSYQILASSLDSMPKPQVWPSAPTVRDVDHINVSPLPGQVIVTLPDGAQVLQPNPPPPWSFGLYKIMGSDVTGGDPVVYKSGGPPISSNQYSGTFPEPPVS